MSIGVGDVAIPEACWPANVLARFMLALSYPGVIGYGLGAGPESPDQDRPANAAMLCDCSALVNWCHRVSRRVASGGEAEWYRRHGGGYANTDGIRADALDIGHGRWDIIERPIPGCVVVFGNGPDVGHCGIWVWNHPRFNGSAAGFGESLVGHCSLGNHRKYGRAIMVTSAAAFYHPGDTVFAVWRGVMA